jgi:hypothetical protein
MYDLGGSVWRKKVKETHENNSRKLVSLME